jgi:MATE family multidrug resistance protein
VSADTAAPDSTVRRPYTLAVQELRAVLALALPLICTQLGQMMLGVTDAAIVGHLSLRALDAITLGNLWQVATMIPLYGVVLGLDPLISQAHGAGRHDEAALALQRSLVLVALLSLPLSLSWCFTEEGLMLLGQERSIAHAAELFTRGQLFAAPAMLGYGALAVYLSARGIVRPGVFAVLVANAFNGVAVWALVFGKLGLPAWGLWGASIATGLTRVVLVLALALIIVRFRLYRDAWVPWTPRVFERRALAIQLGLGLPVGLTLALEVWAFQLGTLIAGRLDATSLAAHSVVLSTLSLTFMVPIGIASGASARVGQLIGASDGERAQRAAHAALGLAAALALGSALFFVLGRVLVPSLYSPDAPVVLAAAAIMPIAGAFTVMDALQAVSGGVLRGMGRPRVTAAFNLVGYFALGTPLAYYLALHTPLRLAGIWVGYAVGVTFVAAGLVTWVLVRGPRTARAIAG